MAAITEEIPLSADPMILYNLYYTPSLTNVTFHQGDKNSPVIYYAQSKILRIHPTFYVHQKSETGPIVSFCQLPCVSKTMPIGLGDGTESKWQEVHRDHIQYFNSDYHFEHNSVAYDWRKDKSKSFATAYECLDDDGKVCATLLSGGAFNWKKGGELHIKKDIDQDLAHLLIAGALGIWSVEALNLKSLKQAF